MNRERLLLKFIRENKLKNLMMELSDNNITGPITGSSDVGKNPYPPPIPPKNPPPADLFRGMLGDTNTPPASSRTIEPMEIPGKGRGLVSRKRFKKGDIILKDNTLPISDEQWEIIKETEPVKLYGFKWGDEHRYASGPFNFEFKDKDEIKLWRAAKIIGPSERLTLSGFNFINDDPDNPNAEESFGDDYSVTMTATRDIEPGEEITKKYNVGDDVASWRTRT